MNPIMFYFLLALTAALAAIANAGKPVLDMDGNNVTFDASYYVRTYIFGGNLSLNTLGGNPCPLYVEWNFDSFLNPKKKEVPIRFSNLGSGAEFVSVNDILGIEMPSPNTTCAQSSYWKLTWFNGTRAFHISTNGTKPDPEKTSSRNFFIIDTYEGLLQDLQDTYVIRRCDAPIHLDCADIKLVSLDDNNFPTSSPKYLAVGEGRSLQVRFKKTND